MDDKVADKILDQMSKMETRLNQKFDGINKKTDRIIDYIFKMEARLSKNIAAYHEEFVEFKNGIYDHIDAVFNELKTTREEQTIAAHRTSLLEDRVEAIEKVPVIAHSIKK